MKIYTKTGDSGTTSLFGGKRVNKDDLRIAASGNIDELNSILGLINSALDDGSVKKKILRVQSELMVVGSNLASPIGLKLKIPKINRMFVSRLEKEIDIWDKQLPQLKNFILPGGSPTASRIHMARAIARRSERSISRLAKSEKINLVVAMYINRLSDWLFVLARYINKLDKKNEIIWFGRNNQK